MSLLASTLFLTACVELVVEAQDLQADQVSDPGEGAQVDDTEPVDDTERAESDQLGQSVGGEVNATVSRIVDGDSMEATLQPGGEEVEVRLVGYNAPELFDDNERTCNGDLARTALEKLLAGSSEVALVEEGTDRFGRLLADVALGPDAAQPTAVAALISSGVGLATGDDESNRRLMIQAADQRLGIWGDQCGQPQSRNLVVAETQVDPDGNDRYNLDDEWVRIENRGDGELSLEGWVIRDDTTGHRFPLSGTLAPGAGLTVRSGEGVGDGENFYLGERFPVWSNQWETVILVDPEGVVANWAFVG